MIPAPRGFALLLALAATLAGLTPAAAQESVRVNGVVQGMSGPTLTLLSDAPANQGRVMLSPALEPVPAPRPRLTIDLSRLPHDDYASIRPGEPIAIVGVVSSDGRRIIASSVIRPTAPQAAPQTP